MPIVLGQNCAFSASLLVKSLTGVSKPSCAKLAVESCHRLTTSGAFPSAMLACRSRTMLSCLSTKLTVTPGLAFSKSAITLFRYGSNLGDKYQDQNSSCLPLCASAATLTAVMRPSANKVRFFIDPPLLRGAKPQKAVLGGDSSASELIA